MSNGRPTAPSYSIVQWATSTNYPVSGDAWDGLSMKTSPAVYYWRPNVAIAAEEINYQLNAGLTTSQQAAKDYFSTLLTFVGQIGALNWPSAMSAQTLTGLANGYIESAAWDAPHYNATSGTFEPGRWLLGVGDDTPRHGIWQSIDGGASWTSFFVGQDGAGLTASTLHVDVVCGDAAGKVVGGPYGSASMLYFDGATWFTNKAHNCAHTGAWDVLIRFNSLFVALGGGHADVSGHGFNQSSTSPTGATWTDRTSALVAYSTSDHLCAATDGTTLVCFGDKAGLQTFGTSTNGTSWTTRTCSAIAGTDKVKAVAYNAAESLWMLTLVRGSTTTRFLTSPDGITWTDLGVSLSSLATRRGLCASGATWISSCRNTVTEKPYLILSVDSGASWQVVNSSGLPLDSTALNSAVRNSPRALVGDGQFLFLNGEGVAASLVTGAPTFTY